ncbi:hypothetical protein BV20DRAFT_601334 [Pilatotrama ljubarskyi]|nr:hypothetical protein BV20DRAFT_601334 [Pilatotrama ljubarskyi]
MARVRSHWRSGTLTLSPPPQEARSRVMHTQSVRRVLSAGSEHCAGRLATECGRCSSFWRVLVSRERLLYNATDCRLRLQLGLLPPRGLRLRPAQQRFEMGSPSETELCLAACGEGRLPASLRLSRAALERQARMIVPLLDVGRRGRYVESSSASAPRSVEHVAFRTSAVVITHLRSRAGGRSGWYRSRRARSQCAIWAIDTDGPNSAARASGRPRLEAWEGFCGGHQERCTELEENKACLKAAHVTRGSGGSHFTGADSARNGLSSIIIRAIAIARA